MKMCFFLQRRFAYVGHCLAVWLKEKYGYNQFCGYVQLRSSYNFLKSQKDINYTALVLDEDVHARYKTEKLNPTYLRWLEKEYGIPNLWPYIAIDRIVMSNQLVREYPWNTPKYTHEEMLRILQVNAKAVISFLDQEKPNVIIISVDCSVPSRLLTKIAQKRGIKILYILTSSLKDKFLVSETYDAFTGAEEIFRRNLVSKEKNAFYYEAKKLMSDFRLSPQPYNRELAPERQPINRLTQFKFLSPQNLLVSAGWLSTILWRHCTSIDKYDYSYIHPWNYLKDHAKRKIRNLVGADDLYDKFNSKENYVFFGLHYEPEASLLLLAPFTHNQIYLIKQSARSLPVGFKLYVKEHPQMVQYRPRSYYKEIKKIPNVKLINPEMSGLEIVRNAKLVLTITGSVGWEALMFQKPVIAFGNQFYNALSMVKRCREIEQLPYLVKEQLENFRYNEEELLYFTAAILEDAATLPFLYLWEHENNEQKKKLELEPLADLLAKKLGSAR